MNINEWKQVLDIIQKHNPNDEDVWPFRGADHDIIYLNLQLSEDSDDGKILDKLGCHLEDGLFWAKFV